jgi:hypothetical protein
MRGDDLTLFVKDEESGTGGALVNAAHEHVRRVGAHACGQGATVGGIKMRTTLARWRNATLERTVAPSV